MNDDRLISLNAAIDALWHSIECENGGELQSYAKAVIGDAEDALKALPSPQPETAKRIVGKSRDGMTLWYQCDMCNEPVDAKDSFCRGCGRRLIDG